MHSMHILGRSGDEKLEWEPGDKASTKQARKKFKELKKQGYRFFEVAEKRGREVTNFAKGLGTVIAAPPMFAGPVVTRET